MTDKTRKTLYFKLSEWPVGIFLIGWISTFVAGILGGLFITVGRTAVDMYRDDHGIFNVAHFYLIDPVLLSFIVFVYAIYMKFSKNQLNTVLIYIHFVATFAFAFLVIWLRIDGIDLPSQDWKDHVGPWVTFEALIFGYGRSLFAIAQLLLVVNLVWSWFFGSARKPTGPERFSPRPA